MKKPFCTLLFASLATLVLGAFLFAQDEAETRRQAFVKGFEQLMKNTKEGLQKPTVKEVFSKDGSSASFEKFRIASVAVPTSATTTTDCNLGIKVWFSLEDGTLFNTAKRKMGVKEKFYVHVLLAVPGYVSLFQNYPESRPESKQVYPDVHYPDTFKVIQAGQVTRLPVLFEMDDDTRDEIMSMVVVRVDSPQIQSTLVRQTISTVTNADGEPLAMAQVAAATDEGIWKAINDQAAKKADSFEKFNVAAPTVTAAVTSTVPNDVAFYMFGAGYAGQWQLTLKK